MNFFVESLIFSDNFFFYLREFNLEKFFSVVGLFREIENFIFDSDS